MFSELTGKITVKEKKMNHRLGLLPDQPFDWAASPTLLHSLNRLRFAVMGFSQQLAQNYRILFLLPFILVTLLILLRL